MPQERPAAIAMLKKVLLTASRPGRPNEMLETAHNSVNATRLHRADNLAGNRRVIGTGGNSQCQRVYNYIAVFQCRIRPHGR